MAENVTINKLINSKLSNLTPLIASSSITYTRQFTMTFRNYKYCLYFIVIRSHICMLPDAIFSARVEFHRIGIVMFIHCGAAPEKLRGEREGFVWLIISGLADR